ncbi:ABC1 atypical kinase-like domain [Dillenia turbinata]|uniref:ABC1 atypical kinase-like domain n=1 Tax=Dillenia turbinata TaxID=194707 RepID=A0AAN8ZEU7_9MAGN
MLLLPVPIPHSWLSFNSNFERHQLLKPSPSHPRRNPPKTNSRWSRIVAPATGDVDTFTKYSGYLFQLSDTEAESLTDYDVSRIGSIYRKRPLVLLRRLVQIGTTLGRWLLLRYVDSVRDMSDQMFEIRASELRKILVELGPAYVKIAQAISSRPDLIPPSYLDQLSLLQDRIAPFSTPVAFRTIEKELGVPIDELFSEISPEPVAAASLGQVYQARLRQSGQIVAVKVQRPGVQAAIALDILLLRFLAGIVRRAGKFNTDLQAIVDEWASSLFREMDYKKEAGNGLKFRQLYGGLKDVKVPQMYMDLTTSKVLVMEWVEGQKLSEVKDLYLVEVGVYCSFNQLLEYGFYHADPHPGNLLRTYDGELAYLDFGMMGEFKQEFRDGFIEACLHLINRDFDALAKDFVTLGLLPPTAEKEAVTKALTGVFQNAVEKGVRNISFGDLLGNLGTTILAVLEGIAISFKPDYKVLSSTYPWIARKVLTDSSPKLKSSLQTFLYKDGVFQIDRLESLLSESLRARTDRALVKYQAEDSDSRMLIKQVVSFTLDEKVGFLREILLEELAKGLDALGLASLDSAIFAATSALPFAASPLSSMTEEDVVNLRTLRRLLLLLSGFHNQQNSSIMVEDFDSDKRRQVYLEEVQLLLSQVPSVQEILPILSIIPELPPDSQQYLLQLPSDLAGRLMSRAAARTIRRIFI